MKNQFLIDAKVKIPVICGAMYPCSNPELIAAVSASGGLGIIQPLSMVFVHGHDLRSGIRMIRQTTSNPIGFNAIIEKSSKLYEDRMKKWIDIALEEGVRFFITALGNPKWVVQKVESVGGIVYHDVTERRFAEKALEGGVKGLVCVNRRAGGHAGTRNIEELFEALKDFKVPLICAGGVGGSESFVRALKIGYQGVQMGTRFIASEECKASPEYKQAIVNSSESDVVLTEKLTGVPVSVIKTPYVEKIGTKAGPVARFLLSKQRTKHWMRLFYSLQSVWKLKRSLFEGAGYQSYFQAGKSVSEISSVLPCHSILAELEKSYSETVSR